ncbi:hypothetical protein PSACC_02458 [Paramicrosporidium saccamoebae]|uniref:Uncharacterized protein n=1 Tax=Paramicrosporidium saccamoebae TaxID=1246581 RepID=A0A2H9TJB4_9FUNG|nr:hypothetical protein PSACC_02458 [Paramicrosporidium saccamoebae]
MKQGALSRLAIILALVDSAAASTTTTTTTTTTGYAANDYQSTIPPIKALGADDEVMLKLSCVTLFRQHDIPSIGGVMSLAKLSDQENWDELTGLAECSAAFSEKGEVLSGVHVRELLTPIWGWDTQGTTAETPGSRLMTLYKLGALSHVKAWDAVTIEDSLEPFEGICLKTLNHWATFKPEVLSEYIAMQGAYSELPRPTEASRRTLRRLLDHKLFRSAKNLNWNIFDSNVMAYLASKSSDLGGKLVECLLHVISGMTEEDSVFLAVLALRTEMFLKLLLTEHDTYESATLGKIVQTLYECRVKIYQTTNLGLVHSLLAHWSPEMTEILTQVQTTLDASLVTSVTSCLLCESTFPLPAPSFDDFYDLVEATDNLPGNFDKNSWYVDFLLLHPSSPADLEKYHHLLNSVFVNSMKDLSQYVNSRKNEYSTSLTPPTMALKLCSTMMRSNVQGVIDCICPIEDLFRGKKHLRRSVLHAMKGKPDVAPICYALVKNENDLRAVAIVTHNTKNKPTWKIEKYDMVHGHNLEETVAFLTNHPDEFANSQLMLKVPQAIDQDGPSRALIDQFLKRIEKELICPLSEVNGIVKRFSWLMGGEAGLIAGMFTGKAIQKNLRATFALDLPFYTLLPYADDEEAVMEYYDKTYKDRVKEFINTKLMQGYERKDFYTDDMYLPTVKGITFTTLGKPSNLLDLGDCEAADLSGCTFDNITKFFEEYHEMIRRGFLEFFRNYAFYLNKTFRVAGIRFMRRPSVLLDTFNAPLLTAKDVIDAIKFSNVENPLVDSFYPGHKILLHDCIRTFIESLTTTQLAKMLTVWTGSSSTVLTPDCLIINVTRNPHKSARLNLFHWEDLELNQDQTVRASSNSMQEEVEPTSHGVASLGDWEGVPAVEQSDFDMESQEMKEAAPEIVDSMTTEEQQPPQKSDTKAVTEELNDSPDYVIRAGVEFCTLVSRVAALQHAILELGPEEVFDPHLLVHDDYDTYPSSTCASLLYVVPQHSYNVVRAMVIFTNSHSASLMDVETTQQPEPAQNDQPNNASNSAEDEDPEATF